MKRTQSICPKRFWKIHIFEIEIINTLSVNPTKWSNTLKEFVGKLPTNCLSVFDHFVGLALKKIIGKLDFWKIT